MGFLNRRGHASAAASAFCENAGSEFTSGNLWFLSVNQAALPELLLELKSQLLLFVLAPQEVLWNCNLFMSGVGGPDSRLRKWEPAEVLAFFKKTLLLSGSLHVQAETLN